MVVETDNVAHVEVRIETPKNARLAGPALSLFFEKHDRAQIMCSHMIQKQPLSHPLYCTQHSIQRYTAPGSNHPDSQPNHRLLSQSLHCQRPPFPLRLPFPLRPLPFVLISLYLSIFPRALGFASPRYIHTHPTRYLPLSFVVIQHLPHRHAHHTRRGLRICCFVLRVGSLSIDSRALCI